MGILHMERVGGLAGFGTSRARIRSHGQCDTAQLSKAEAEVVEKLFQSTPSHSASVSSASPASPDAFTLRLTRTGAQGTQSVVVPESAVPPAVLRHLKDELL
jgi:hypothetical protein